MLHALLLLACNPAGPPPGDAPTDASTPTPTTTSSTTTPSTPAPTGSTPTLPTWSGSLEAARDRILDDLSAARDSGAYAPSDPPTLDAFRSVASRLANGDLDVTDLLAPIGYEAVLVPDATNDERPVVVVWEVEPTQHRGAMMVALDSGARSVVLESPHPQYDSLTGVEGFDLFVGLRARAWLVATAHRCANTEPSGCDGTTSACGASAPYVESDMAHAMDGAFQALHEGLMDADGALIAVQLHGFGQGTADPHAYISNGTSVHGDASLLSNRLTAALDLVLPDGAVSCNDAADDATARLCGTTNTQGRYTNGSAVPCTEAASTASGRFLHVEQARELRDVGGPAEPAMLLDALDAVLP